MNLSSNVSTSQLSVYGCTSAALQQAFALARSAWPAIELTYEEFHDYLTRGQTNATVPAYPADVYLCTACVNGQPIAYRALETKYFPTLKAAISHVVGEKPAVDDVLQEVRTRLFVGGAPKIASYRGTGSLAGWLRRVAMHASQDYHRERAAHRARLRTFFHNETATARAWEEPTPDGGARHSPRLLCERAWRHAVMSLQTSERQLLHHYFVLGLSIDNLSPIYAVHRSTVARRIDRIIMRLKRHVRKMLSPHYRDLGARDLDALVLDLCCEVDVQGALAS
jgi:RNA polymerase sigma-70 factor, ECF subfamily